MYKIVLTEDMLSLFRIDVDVKSGCKILVVEDKRGHTRGFVLEEDVCVDSNYSSCDSLSDMKYKFMIHRTNLRNTLIKAMRGKIEQAGLNGLVRRKKDGKKGWLIVTEEAVLEFHHRTKSGEKSQKASGWSLNLDDYEPCDEGGKRHGCN